VADPVAVAVAIAVSPGRLLGVCGLVLCGSGFRLHSTSPIRIPAGTGATAPDVVYERLAPNAQPFRGNSFRGAMQHAPAPGRGTARNHPFPAWARRQSEETARRGAFNLPRGDPSPL